MRRPSPVQVLMTVGLFVCSSLSAGQQSSSALSLGAQKIREKIRALTPGAMLTLLMKGRPEYHGDLVLAGERSLSLYEVDEKQTVNVSYEDVKEVRRGYGGYNSVSSRHVDPVRNRIAFIAIGAGLVAIVAAVAAAKD